METGEIHNDQNERTLALVKWDIHFGTAFKNVPVCFSINFLVLIWSPVTWKPFTKLRAEDNKIQKIYLSITFSVRPNLHSRGVYNVKP